MSRLYRKVSLKSRSSEFLAQPKLSGCRLTHSLPCSWQWVDDEMGVDLTGHRLSFRFEQVYPASLKAANLWFVRWCVSLGSFLFVMNQLQIWTILKHCPSYVYFMCTVSKQRSKECVGNGERIAFCDSSGVWTWCLFSSSTGKSLPEFKYFISWEDSKGIVFQSLLLWHAVKMEK